MPLNSQSSSDWLKKAEEDLESAKILFKESTIYNTIGFHCQQTVEKSLKAYLYAQKVAVKKSHDLVYLLTNCAKFSQDFFRFEDDCKILNTYYIPMRYPILEMSLSKRQAEQALEIADKLLNFVSTLLEE
jgi:HEPN domain-containing protein